MLSLIILSYNDARSLQEIVPDWNRVLSSLDIPNGYEIIIADDGSSDNTEQVALSLASAIKQVRYIRNETNKGVGANFRLGLEHAKGDLVAYTDGDGQYIPEDIITMLRNLGDYDMVTGKRIRRADPFVRTLTSKIYNRLVRTVYPVSVKDINSGLKLFRRSFIDCCIPQVSNGPFYDAEYLIKGHAKGMKIKEIPIHHRPRKYGKPAGVSMRSIKFLFREIGKNDMSAFTHRNYFSRMIFKVLTTRSILLISISNTVM